MKKSLTEIENEFRMIAESNNVVGDSVEVLIKLLAYNRFESMTSVDNTLLEFLPDTAVNINSRLSHAANEMYSVGRGRNAIVKVDALVTGNVTLQKYDRVYSARENTLFFLSASLDGEPIIGGYNFIYGKTYELTLLKAEKLYTESVSVDSDNKYLIELLDNNISETYTLTNPVGNEVQITKDFGKHIDSSIYPTVQNPALAFDLTLSNYGLRLYAPDSNGFSTSGNYTINYFKFLDEIINADDLLKLKIPGFKLDLDTLVVEQRVARESTSNLLYNLKREMISQSRSRANEDIVNLFKKYFSQVIKDASMNEYDLINDKITINYIPDLSNDLFEPYDPLSIIDIVEMQPYIDSLRYYVTKNIEQVAIMDSDALRVEMDLSIVVSELIDTQLVLDIVDTYEYKLGKKINKDEFIGDINNIPGVRYCSLRMVHLNADDPLNPGETIELEVDELETPINKYLLITPDLNYTYRRNGQ